MDTEFPFSHHRGFSAQESTQVITASLPTQNNLETLFSNQFWFRKFRKPMNHFRSWKNKQHRANIISLLFSLLRDWGRNRHCTPIFKSSDWGIGGYFWDTPRLRLALPESSHSSHVLSRSYSCEIHGDHLRSHRTLLFQVRGRGGDRPLDPSGWFCLWLLLPGLSNDPAKNSS